jgi:phage antirepressor YoqD-like protein
MRFCITIKGDGMELVLTQSNGTTTMTSLQLVDYINHLRKQEGNGTYTELRHDSFMVKVPQVLKATPINFGVVNFVANQGATRERKIAIFEKREAMLMAMSYSYDIQAVVYDAWEAAEKALLDNSTITLPNFLNPTEAAKAWAVQYERNVESTKQLVIAQEKVAEALPKIESFDLLMGCNKTFSVLETSKLLEVGQHKLFKALRKQGYVSENNVPYERFCVNGIGLFKVKLSKPFRNPSTGNVEVTRGTEVTSKGVEYLRRKMVQGKLL